MNGREGESGFDWMLVVLSISITCYFNPLCHFIIVCSSCKSDSGNVDEYLLLSVQYSKQWSSN